MRIFIAVCLFVGTFGIAAGCCDSGWSDFPATVTPVAPSEYLGDWTIQVNYAITNWNEGLAALGCPEPFQLGVGGHRVMLVPPEEWHDPDKAGFESNGTIEVLQGNTMSLAEGGSAVVRHELGHGLGLGHADPAYGPSIMTSPAGGMIYPRDFAAAACRLGCGPCDGADPYNR